MSARALPWSIAAMAIVKLAGIASGIATARLLGPAGRGELAGLLAWLGVFAALGASGLDQATCLQIARRPDGHARIVAIACALAAVSGLVAAAAMIAVVGPRVPALVLVAAALPALGVGQVIAAADQARLRFRRRALHQATQPLTYVLAIAAIAAVERASVTTIAAAYLFAAGLAAAARLWTLERPAMDRSVAGEARALLRQGATLQLPHLAATAIARIELVIAAAVLPAEAVGHYAVAFAIAFASAGAVEAHGRVAFARLARASSPRAQTLVLRAALPQVLLLAIAIGGVTWVATPWLVVTAYGPAFAPAIAPARWLVAGWTALSLALWIDPILRACDRSRASAAVLGVAAIVLAIAGPLAATRHGPVGLAIAVLAIAVATTVGLAARIAPLVRRVPAEVR